MSKCPTYDYNLPKLIDSCSPVLPCEQYDIDLDRGVITKGDKDYARILSMNRHIETGKLSGMAEIVTGKQSA